jgi:hypothetical protein
VAKAAKEKTTTATIAITIIIITKIKKHIFLSHPPPKQLLNVQKMMKIKWTSMQIQMQMPQPLLVVFAMIIKTRTVS